MSTILKNAIGFPRFRLVAHEVLGLSRECQTQIIARVKHNYYKAGLDFYAYCQCEDRLRVHLELDCLRRSGGTDCFAYKPGDFHQFKHGIKRVADSVGSWIESFKVFNFSHHQ
jgi:hypothetical protein